MTKSKSDIVDVSDLLKPRIIVENNYPRSPFKHYEIICEPSAQQLEWAKEFPVNFRFLNWWEEREASEMPEYVRFYEPLPEKFSIWKVTEWRFGLKRPLIKTDCDVVWRELSIGDLPATLDEYNQYINKDK